jgi:hypothetical protein
MFFKNIYSYVQSNESCLSFNGHAKLLKFILGCRVISLYKGHSGWMTVWYAPCIPDSHSHRVTNTKCLIDAVISPDDGHIVARNI